MTDYQVINGTDAELTNINAGGFDVAARTVSANVTLTQAELETVASMNGVAVMQASPTAAEKGSVASALADALSTGYDLSTVLAREQFKRKKGIQEYEDLLDALAL